MAEEYNFQYTPLTGRLPGKSFVEQTEKAINELAEIVNEGSAQVEVITNLANQANDNSEEALEMANEALETSSRVYITLPNLDDADDYFDSQLYYFANEYSANLPVQDTGFLEVKTNDTKTAAEQVFIADITGLMYLRHGNITTTEVGDETVYSVTWETWSSALASETYVQNELTNYLPLSGGTMTGNITVSSTDWKIKCNTDDNALSFWAGSNWSKGAYMSLYGINHAQYPGWFRLYARDSSTSVELRGKPDGTLTWNGQPLLPVGVVQAYAGTTIPNGWLLCDGSAVSRTTYENLYACIGDTYGSGDGSTTFNLPNLVDKFIEGSSTAGTEKSAGLPNITGNFDPSIATGNATSNIYSLPIDAATGAFSTINNSTRPYFTKAGTTDGTFNRSVSFDASRSSSVYGNSTTVQPPALTMRYIIKY